MSAAMNKELRRTSIVVLLMFVTLFVSTSIIQVISADELRDDPRNSRTFYANMSVNRGPILVDGIPIAESIAVDGPIAYQRVYANGPLYSAVTGYMTIGQGNTGLEADLNGFLSGTTGGQFFDQVRQILSGQSPQGAAVETTIDAYVQQVAWDALGDYTGAVIAIRPATGEILAMVSKPTFDPNSLAVHDTEAVIALYEQLLADPLDPLINRTMNGNLDPPGSTFKIVVAAAALGAGYTADSPLPNPATLTLPGSDSVVYNADRGTCGPGETVTLADALRLSCNSPCAELGLQLGYRTILEQAMAFGFNESVDVPMVSTPSVYPRVLDDAQTMLSAFGQSDVRASPLQMAMVSAAIANQGVLMQPTLIEAIIAPDQTTLQSLTPTSLGQPITQAQAETLVQMMVANVSSGAASGAIIDGVEVAGKTGTAQNGDDEPYTLWFTGFAPANNPEVAVAVVIQDGGGLGQDGTSNGIPAPIGRAVMEAVLSR